MMRIKYCDEYINQNICYKFNNLDVYKSLDIILANTLIENRFFTCIHNNNKNMFENNFLNFCFISSKIISNNYNKSSFEIKIPHFKLISAKLNFFRFNIEFHNRNYSCETFMLKKIEMIMPIIYMKIEYFSNINYNVTCYFWNETVSDEKIYLLYFFTGIPPPLL